MRKNPHEEFGFSECQIILFCRFKIFFAFTPFTHDMNPNLESEPVLDAFCRKAVFEPSVSTWLMAVGDGMW